MVSQHERIAGEFLDAAVDAGGWQHALLDLAHACKAQVGSMVLVDKSTGAGVGFCLGIEEQWSSVFVRQQARLVARGSSIVQPGAVFTDRMVEERREFERSGFFESWARPSGQTDYAGVAVMNDSNRFVFVGLSRGPKHGAFQRSELDSLERLAPYVRRASRIWVALGAAEEARRTIESAFDHLAHAVFLTDARARIKFANSAAAELLAQDGGLRSRANVLSASTESESSRLHQLVRAAACRSNTLGAGRLKLAASNGAGALTVLVTPLSASLEDATRHAEVMVIAIDPLAAARRSSEQLRAYFGLTRTEALLASHIVKGNGLKAAALALGIAPTTARTHLNRIFDKTGTKSQVALATLLTAVKSSI